MRAAVLVEYGEPLDIRDVDRPSIDPGGALVAVEACGVCRSDWHAWRGHGEWADDRVERGQVLGHEPAGRVVEVGDRVETARVGDRVAVPFSLGCGSCESCRSGHGNVCGDDLALGFEADAPGAFAEYVHVPAADYNAARLPEGVSMVDAAALGCRYMTAFNALRERAAVGGGDWVAVFGCGGLGLSAVQLARAMGANVVAVDIDEEKLATARDLGARATVNASHCDDPAARVRREANGSDDGDATGAHVTIDAVGSAETCRAAVGSLRPRGVHVQAGLTGEDERGEISLPTDVMARHELSFLGVRGMSPTRYDALFRMIAGGAVDPGELVSRELALEEVSDRLAAMSGYGTEGIEVVTEF